jgi:DNA-binding GntR family transcriptional regulator
VTASGEVQGGRHGRAIALEGLRNAILQGFMVPGQRLIDADLVEMFGVSRASVRSAIDDLVVEGLVERIHNRGARVRTVQKDEALEILECRRALEALIAARAAERADNDDIARLRAHGDLLSQAVREGNLAKYSMLNNELHAMLSVIADHHAAADLIGRLNTQIVRHQFQLTRRPGWSHETVGQHLAIIEAVAARDPEAAARAMSEHLTSVIDAIRQTA